MAAAEEDDDDDRPKRADDADVACIVTEVDIKSPMNAKTLRITLYTQNWGRFPKVDLA